MKEVKLIKKKEDLFSTINIKKSNQPTRNINTNLNNTLANDN